MTATIPAECVYLAVLCIFVLAALAWSRGCRCEKCAFHQNETRVKRLREKDERHEWSHRQWDSCGDTTCPRHHERHKRLDK